MVLYRLTKQKDAPGSLKNIKFSDKDLEDVDIFYEELPDGRERLSVYKKKDEDAKKATGKHLSAS